MGRQNIYKQMSVASVMPTAMLQDLMDFLITNRGFILSEDKTNEAFKTRFSQHSLLSEMVYRLTLLKKDQAYRLIRLPSKTVALREAIDMTFIPIDILQMKELIPTSSKTLSHLSELDDKLIINVTDITKANGDFSDITQFHYRVIRDFLSRSFYASSGNIWISPTLIRYVAKVYSMTLGGRIARLCGLSPLVQSFIQTLFCAFFVGQMTSEDVAQTFLLTHNKYMGLPEVADLKQVLSFIEDVLHKPVPTSLEEVCTLIAAYDHDQLKTAQKENRITRPVLNMSVASLFPDNHVSIIALEYPPYFVFLILLVLSNIRIGLSFPMKNMNLMREGQDVFEQTLKSSTLFNSL